MSGLDGLTLSGLGPAHPELVEGWFGGLTWFDRPTMGGDLGRLLLGQELEGGVGRYRQLLRPAAQLLDAALADASRRHVDHPQEADGIEGVVNQAQVGQEVLDLAPLVEAGAAHQAIGDAAADEGLLEGAGLGVGAVHDGEGARRVGVVLGERLHLFGHEGRLLLFVVGLAHHHPRATLVLRPQALLLALAVDADDVVGRIEDGLGGAIVLLQIDDAGVGEIALEVEDVAQVGCPPGVDGLVGVAHDADVAVAAGELAGEHVLGDVGVLELVDVDVQVALGVLVEDVGVLAKELDGLHQEVIEIDGVVLLQRLLIALVHPRDDLLEVVAHEEGEGLGGGQLALGARDGGQHGPRRCAAGVEAQILHHRPDYGELVGLIVDGEGLRQADALAVHAQDASADGVEGAQRYVAADVGADEAEDAVAHLAGGLVGEGDSEDAAGVNPLVGDEVGDAVGDDAGLAAAGPRQDKERPLADLHSLALSRIQAREYVHPPSRRHSSTGRQGHSTLVS